VVGQLANSKIYLALIFSTLSNVILFSKAAGTKISHFFSISSSLEIFSASSYSITDFLNFFNSWIFSKFNHFSL
jgi:hypothetical protein